MNNPELRDWVVNERFMGDPELSDAEDTVLEKNQPNREKAAKEIIKTVPEKGRKKINKHLNLEGLKLTDLPEYLVNSQAATINLSDNFLNHLPYSLTELINLTHLDLSKNNLAEIPEEMSKLLNLQNLNLSSNNLVDISEVVSDLANLKSLKLDNNQITTITDTIVKLIDLEEFSVSNNNLRALAPEIGEMQRLKKLDLSNNPELRAIPQEWEDLIIDTLTHLNLKNTGLNNFPEMRVHPENLKELHLEENREMVTLPNTFGPMLQSKQPDKLKTTKRKGHINIYTKDSPLISGLASQGRVQIKHGDKTIMAGRNLPELLLRKPEDFRNDYEASVDHMSEPMINDAPANLAADQADIINKWEEIKKEGAGPIELAGLKRQVDKQNLLTIFAYTYAKLVNAEGADLNVKEFNLSLNAKLAEPLGLLHSKELVNVGATRPVPEFVRDEAITAVETLTVLNDELINFSASQIAPLARNGASIFLSDLDIANRIHEIKNFHNHTITREIAGIYAPEAANRNSEHKELNNNVSTSEINKVYGLAKGAFRQNLINKVANIFVHFMSQASPNFNMDGVEASILIQHQLEEALGLPGKVAEVTLPKNLQDKIYPEEFAIIEDIILSLEDVDNRALFKHYLETKPFWKEYVNSLADRLTVSNKSTTEREKHEIKERSGWTQDYKEMARGLFRQERLHLISHVDIYTRNEDQAIDNPKLVSLNLQIQLAERLGLPITLREFPQDVASLICWRVPPNKLDSIAQAVLDYENKEDGQLFENFLNTQDFWKEHLKEKNRLYELQNAVDKGLKITSDIFDRAGLKMLNYRW